MIMFSSQTLQDNQWASYYLRKEQKVFQVLTWIQDETGRQQNKDDEAVQESTGTKTTNKNKNQNWNTE